MQINNLSWKIGGEAGFGIMSSGAVFGKVCMRHGLHVVDYVEYPSLIRGGHNVYTVRVSQEPLYAANRDCHIVIALNKETIALHQHTLATGGALIYDGEAVKDPGITRTDIKVYSVPMLRIARESKAGIFMMNGVAVGATLALIGADLQMLHDIFEEQFGHKGPEVVELNNRISLSGFDHIIQNYPDDFEWKLQKVEAPKRMLISGTEAMGMGAIKAGLKFFAAYPMTPISNLLAYIVAQDEKYNIVYKQPEDEIAAINMALGASYAGARAMTTTAGGGFSLMVESVGLAGMTETPLVIVMGMRPGPATGMPTWTGQADVRFVLHAGQDDFPKIILAPGDPKEAFYLVHQAFNLADKYQLPVLVLTDKHLMESKWSMEPFDTTALRIERGKMMSDEAATEMGENYLRYRFTTDGISPRKIPGQPGRPFLAGSDEHSENSLFNEQADNRVKMMHKRMNKLEVAKMEIPQPQLFGPEEAPITIVGFGTTKTAVLEAFKTLNAEGPLVNYLHYTYIWPLQVEKLQDLTRSGKKLIGFEGNYTGQFLGLLFEHSGVDIPVDVVRYDGRQFFPEDIISQITKYKDFTPVQSAIEYWHVGGEPSAKVNHPTNTGVE